jgi:hypothetical protein
MNNIQVTLPVTDPSQCGNRRIWIPYLGLEQLVKTLGGGRLDSWEQQGVPPAAWGRRRLREANSPLVREKGLAREEGEGLVATGRRPLSSGLAVWGGGGSGLRWAGPVGTDLGALGYL